MNAITSLIRRGDIERKIKLTKIKQKYGHNSDVIRFIYSHSSRDFFCHLLLFYLAKKKIGAVYSNLMFITCAFLFISFQDQVL